MTRLSAEHTNLATTVADEGEPDSQMRHLFADLAALASRQRVDRRALEEARNSFFSVVVRSIERRDRTMLCWLADRLSFTSRLFRDRASSPPVWEFAGYCTALSEVTWSLSSNTRALSKAHLAVGRSRYIVPMLGALRDSRQPLTHARLSSSLGIEPAHLSQVAAKAREAGVIADVKVGRHKYYSVTPLGEEYLEELQRPIMRLVASRVLQDFWTYASQDLPIETVTEELVSRYGTYSRGAVLGMLECVSELTRNEWAFSQIRATLSDRHSLLVVFVHSVEVMDDSVREVVEGAKEVKGVVEGAEEDRLVLRPLCDTRRIEILYSDVIEDRVRLIDVESNTALPVPDPNLAPVGGVFEQPPTASCPTGATALV